MSVPRATQPVYRDLADAVAAPLDPQVFASLLCDVSFISDDSTSPDALVARQVAKVNNNPRAASLLWDIYDRLRNEYDGGSTIGHPSLVLSRVHQAAEMGGFELSVQQLEALVRFFDHVNQVMFQHQTLTWLAGTGFKLHIYGRGWETNSFFAPHARGEIESDATRLAIYRASRINVAASAYGAVQPRVVEGVSAGGFFLLRFCPADVIERFFPPLLELCEREHISTNAELIGRATPAMRRLLDFASRTLGMDVLRAWPQMVAQLRSSADAGYTRSAAAIWPNYPSIAFSAKDELIGLISRYLYDVPQRAGVAVEMRKQLTARFQHVRVNRRVARSEIAA